MMQKAWSMLGEVPYCFSMSSVKFKGYINKKSADFDPNWNFQDCNSSFNLQMAMEWCTKLEVAKKRCPIFWRSSVKFQGHIGKTIFDFYTNWAVTKFEWTDGYEMMHKAWSSEEEVP